MEGLGKGLAVGLTAITACVVACVVGTPEALACMSAPVAVAFIIYVLGNC